MSAHELITEHLDLWTQAVTQKSTAGRGGASGKNGKIELTGIKKLRVLILELAVRGKLMEQDPDDEPAHLILERLDSTVKKNKGKPQAYSGASQSSLPNGWASFRVGDYLDFQYGKSLPAKQRDNSGSTEVYGSNGVVGFHTEALTEEPCIIVGRKGSAGALNKALAPSWTTDVAYYVQPPKGFDFEFTYLLLQSLHLDQLGKGIKPGVNRNEAYALTASLPPLAEQHRIVQKVDELMALCDRLEQHTSDQLDAHATLVDTLLGTLTQSANATELADNWACLAEHFDTLFTTEQSIDKLKQTILQLAVMGRLVEQDAGDEPVEVLFSQIWTHQHDRYQLKEIQKPKQIKVSDSLDIEPPLSWRKASLNDLAFVTKLAGFEYTKHLNLQDEGEVPVIRAQNVRSFKPDTSNLKYIDLDTSLQLQRSAIDRTCLLITFIGAGIGDVCTMAVGDDERWHLAPNVAKVEPFGNINPRFINTFLCSPSGQKELFKSVKSTAQPSLSMTTIREIWIPIPPLAEQHRIVQKVDELMALCDHLKQRLTQASNTRCQLAGAVVEGALN